MAAELGTTCPQTRPRDAWKAWLLCCPAVVWLMLFVFLPLMLIVGVSFLSRGEYGQMELPFSIENYRRLAGWSEFGFSPLYPQVLVRTVVLATAVTLMSLSGALFLAFFIARLGPRSRPLALALVVIPFWTNLLIRTYAWQILLGPEGPLAWVASWLGWIPPGTGLHPGWLAVMLAMFCDFLPFMVLPVYASVEKIDWTLPEAAADLGADRRQVFRHAIVPQILPGIRAGVILVFLPALGQFVIPDLLGGGHITLLGNLIQQQFGPSRDWPFGGAVATMMLLVLVILFSRRRRRLAEPMERPHL